MLILELLDHLLLLDQAFLVLRDKFMLPVELLLLSRFMDSLFPGLGADETSKLTKYFYFHFREYPFRYRDAYLFVGFDSFAHYTVNFPNLRLHVGLKLRDQIFFLTD